METSIDWSHELVNSLFWVAKAVGISAIASVVVAALLFRFTKWGRQFWRISGAYFRDRGAWKVYLLLLALIVGAVLTVRMNVLFSYNGNDTFTALQLGAQALAGQGDLQVAKDGFWSAVKGFAVLAVIWVALGLVNFYVGQAFDIRWRVWLTERVTTDYLEGRAYYRGRFIDDSIDNPDQRIQADITDYVQSSRTLSIGALSAILSIVSFAKILWDLSGPLSLLGVEIPRAMVFLVVGYVLVTTIIAFWIGRPLIGLNFLNERFGANFRYALVRLRDGAENVAFYRGERVERQGLLTRFAAVIRNYWAIVFRSLKFNGWNLAVNQTANIIPLVFQGPRVFTGDITLGAVSQSSTAFGQIHDSLSFFRESYDDFASYRASLIRLDGLLTANEESRRLPKVDVSDSAQGLGVSDVVVQRPDGTVLIDDLDLALASGDALVVKGASGSGKTTLLRSLAEMWPYGSGSISRPSGDATLFLSQLPYIPLGDLRTAVAYPAAPDDIDSQAMSEALEKVALGHIVARLDEEQDWAKILSPGEQQRVAFARILLLRPDVVFLDEATSAVDEGLEFSLYRLVRTEVPDCILVSVAHRSTVDQHHTQRLELMGDGAWAVEPIG